MRQQTLRGAALTTRLVAKPELRARIEAQGRRLDWVADRLSWSKSRVTRVLAGERGLTLADARVIAALLDGDLDVLFVLSDGSDELAGRSTAESEG